MLAQTLQGEYRLHGVPDMASAFRFTKDGKFEFFYIYGAADRLASGTYTLEGSTIKLKSDKPPGKDFAVRKQKKQGSGYTIQATAPNPYLLNNIVCLYYSDGIQEMTFSDPEGKISIDKEKVDSLFLLHELFPDYPTMIKGMDLDYNFYEVELLPSLGQVSFKGIDFRLNKDTITCLPNMLFPFEGIRFIKDE